MVGSIYTLGYARPEAAAQLEQLMVDPMMLLVDVRYAARSRWLTQWSKKQLLVRWGERYIHEPRLGNVNYRERHKPIVLADPDAALEQVVSWLHQGFSVVLLCGCVNEQTCHRRLVAEQLLALVSR
ncbi:DUF488 domain-containing protein [Dictyobacter kobayashii]|uniref:DUF488 domain-containing protein n=1 Tax=Dictyobacter kobayashii TaxID=2014872 RepID=A0A402AHN6_9CHLR|nr:DUF488 domain-containing protein [Dictyobacter kobayashii]GCE18630.1 hypothetical protein KDK_24300 [Dictyobacter kobayashii]